MSGYDSNTLTALGSGAVVLRDLLWVAGWDSEGDAATWGFWTGEGNVSINVISGVTGSSVSRSYVGGGTLLEPMPAIVDFVGLESRSIDFNLSIIHTSVRDMVFGAIVKGARVELHRALFDPASWALVSTPYVRFMGRVETADPTIGAAGGEGGIALGCTSDLVELTRTNPALKSDETQRKLHADDRYRRYDTAGLVDRRWGMARGRAKK